MSYNSAYPSNYDSKECKTIYNKESSEAPDHQRLKMFYYLAFCNRAIGFLLISLVIFWIFQYRGGVFFHHFNWHPLFMIFGMVFTYSRGMLFYRTERTISMSRLKLMYARIMIVSVILVVTGLVAGLENNDLQSAYQSTSEMYSMHSCFGFISVILFFSQGIADLFSYLYPPGINQQPESTYVKWKTCLAMSTFLGAVISCLLGFNEMADFYANQGGDYGSENITIWFIYLVLTTFGGLSLYLYYSDSYKRLERPDDEDLLAKTAVFKHLCCIPWSFQECTYSLRMLFSRPNSSPVIATVDT